MGFDPLMDGCKCSYFDGVQITPFPNHDLLSRRTYISPEAIRNKYIPLGYNNFKISIRHNKAAIIENFAKYAIKPEYQQDFRINIWDICSD